MNAARAIVLAVATNAIALAVAFGVNLSASRQDALLAFVGTVTTAAAATYVWWENRKLHAKALVATSATQATQEHAAAAASQVVGTS